MQLATSRHQAKVKERRERAKKSGAKKTSAWKELVQGLALYAFCIALPGIVGLLIHFYDTHVVSFANSHMGYLPPWLTGEEDDVGTNNGSGEMNDGEHGRDDKEINLFSFLFFSLKGIGQFYDDTANYLCGSSLLSSENAERCRSWSLSLRSAISQINRTFTTTSMHRTTSTFEGIIFDVQYLVTLSVMLALIRVLLVHMLVPRYLAPRRLAAFMRCKSTHLLSSSAYQFSPIREKPLKRISAMRLNSLDGDTTGVGFVASDNLGDGQDRFVIDTDAGRNASRSRMRSGIGRILDFLYSVWCSFRSAFRRATGHEPAAPYESLDATAALRLFSAPKYATAIFRLIYCTVSCTAAFILFRSADFWPAYVGGKPTSSTKNCWDLSGTIALGSLDFDFDHRNVALHFFFLAQASYQVHSLFFHIVSMVLLLLYGGKKDGTVVSMKSSMKSYLRPLVEHFITLGLIFGAYIFSGLRRLGAITIFTLEFSSIFLQLLQICINAPDDSRLRKPKVVALVHRYVVIPIFVYCRFLVFPTLWYSAAFESEEWLDQIERAFRPGSALALYIFFNALLMLIFGLNLVFFRRLLFHPLLRTNTKEKAPQYRT